MEKASRKIISMPVYSINEGHYLGHVKNLVIDPAEKRLIALLVEQKLWGKEEKIVPFAKVQGLGEDAITIDRTNSLQRRINIPQILQNMHHPIQLVGIKVLTDGGRTLGKIEEYYIDSVSGSITSLEIAGSRFKSRLALKSEDIITMAAAAIIVASQTAERLETIETPLAETAAGAKEAAAALVAGTVSLSKKISQGIASSLNKYKTEQTGEPEKAAEEKEPVDACPPEETPEETPEESPPEEEKAEKEE